METYEMSESFEKILQNEADLTHTPLSGTIELLPLCNMACKMCYVRQTKEEMNAQGRMLNCDEWLRIAREACEKGLLFLLLTGGEPLLYPEFKRLYVGLAQMGIVLQVNTNGTLINEEWADFFCTIGVRRLNITLYGTDDATYGTLCNNYNGFKQVLRAAELLKARNVQFRFNCSVTPDNIEQLSEFQRIADSFDVFLNVNTYMFPGIRRGITTEEQYRLTPEQAAMAKVYGIHPINIDKARGILSELEQTPRLKNCVGFPCRAGHSNFSINWKGELLPCISFQEPKISLLEHSFGECWDYIVDACKKVLKCQACIDCALQNICQVCLAHCYSETGSAAGCPEYICQMTKYMVRELKKIVGEK